MRSFIKLANRTGIKAVVDQQFHLANQIIAAGLVPIIEPEVDIRSTEKGKAEEILKESITEQLGQLAPHHQVILKLSLPDVDDFYSDLVRHPNVLRVVALSGGYRQREADVRLSANHGLVASFSRALTEGLSVHQSDAEFDATLRALDCRHLRSVPYVSLRGQEHRSSVRSHENPTDSNLAVARPNPRQANSSHVSPAR